MKRTSLLRCVAPAAPATPLQWESVRLPAWRRQRRGICSNSSSSNTSGALESFQLLGQSVGPRPLVVLNTAVPYPSSSSSAGGGGGGGGGEGFLQKWHPSLSHLKWKYGCVSVPFYYNPEREAAGGDTASIDWLDAQCGLVLELLDALGVGWTHCIGHGSGALVAARLTCKAPDRIGSIVLMDSPLLTKQWMKNEKIREEVALAQEDINVPATLLEMQLEELSSKCEQGLEVVPSLVADGGVEASLMKGYLFDPKFIFREKKDSTPLPSSSSTSFRTGHTRDDARYLMCREVEGIRHPLTLLSPSQGAIADAQLHKEVFSIRRGQPVKTAKSHEELFSAGAAEEVAGALQQWLLRFEPEVVVQRRVEQAMKDSKAKLDALSAPPQQSGGTAAAAGAAPAGAAQGKKKGGDRKDKSNK